MSLCNIHPFFALLQKLNSGFGLPIIENPKLNSRIGWQLRFHIYHSFSLDWVGYPVGLNLDVPNAQGVLGDNIERA
jgi:hypothetical protein